MKVSIQFDNKNDKERNIVVFRSSVKIITFEKKISKLYKFTVNDENRSLLCDSDSSIDDKPIIKQDKNTIEDLGDKNKLIIKEKNIIRTINNKNTLTKEDINNKVKMQTNEKKKNNNNKKKKKKEK
jgi:hypothetical protein